MSAPPFFLLGSPRSGTTLLRLLLTAHPDLAVAPESSFATWLEPEFRTWVATDVNSPRLDRYLDALTAARKFSTWGISRDAIRDAARASMPDTYAALTAIPYRLYAASLGKPTARWGDKNNVHLEHIPLLARLFPGAAFIHLVRDVRDTFASSEDVHALPSSSPFKPALSRAPDEFGRSWARDNAVAADDLMDLPHVLVRYEDLVVDTRGALTPVLDLLGVTWDPAVGNHTSRTGVEPPETMPWKELTLQPVTASRVGRFRSVLTLPEITALEAAAGSELRRWGYGVTTL